LADASGALLTRYPEGLARALEKISLHAKPLRTASNATAHLFLENPFGADSDASVGAGKKGGRKTSWVVKLFSTHPPVEERVAMLRQ
jgi:heat shock protein HtpX